MVSRTKRTPVTALLAETSVYWKRGSHSFSPRRATTVVQGPPALLATSMVMSPVDELPASPQVAEGSILNADLTPPPVPMSTACGSRTTIALGTGVSVGEPSAL